MKTFKIAFFALLFMMTGAVSASSVTITESNLLDSIDEQVNVGTFDVNGNEIGSSSFSTDHSLTLTNLVSGNHSFKLLFTLSDNQSGSISGLRAEVWNNTKTTKIYDITTGASNPIPALLLASGNYYLRVIGDAVTASIDAFGALPTEQQYSLDINSAAVPLPAAAWLFGSALMGLFGASRRKSTAVAA